MVWLWGLVDACICCLTLFFRIKPYMYLFCASLFHVYRNPWNFLLLDLAHSLTALSHSSDTHTDRWDSPAVLQLVTHLICRSCNSFLCPIGASFFFLVHSSLYHSRFLPRLSSTGWANRFNLYGVITSSCALSIALRIFTPITDDYGDKLFVAIIIVCWLYKYFYFTSVWWHVSWQRWTPHYLAILSTSQACDGWY